MLLKSFSLVCIFSNVALAHAISLLLAFSFQHVVSYSWVYGIKERSTASAVKPLLPAAISFCLQGTANQKKLVLIKAAIQELKKKNGAEIFNLMFISLNICITFGPLRICVEMFLFFYCPNILFSLHKCLLDVPITKSVVCQCFLCSL